MRKSTFLVALATFAFVGASFVFADESKTMFPFVIEKGAPENITNVKTWSQVDKVAGEDGFIVDSLGSFSTKSGKTRLLGTNLCFSGNFPSTKEKAERVAATLARFGIGVVRLHHMDSRDIWGKNFDKSTTEIDPDQLDKLDYLIYCLHRQGIYVNINLHVSRAFKERDGFENAGKLPTQNKGVDNFDRKMIELQKKYAKDLLQHVNSYTGLAYVDDPGVAVVEINNENSVVASWSWGELDDLPSPYVDNFRKYWNEWLVKKYGTTEKLNDAWNCKTYPLGDESIAEGVFDANFKLDANSNWTFERDKESRQSYQILEPQESGLDVRALRFEVEKAGQVGWIPQFSRVNLAIKEGKPYKVSFKIRSKNNSTINVGVIENHDPWSPVGFRKSVEATKEWKEVNFAFIAPRSDSAVRLTFNNLDPGESFDLANVSFREGGVVGLTPEQTLETSTVPVPKHSGDENLLGAQALADFADFLHDLENGYWQEMYAYVKGLGVKSLTTGTQLQYGYWYNQGRLDYCDIHAYWNHPNFPRRSWDSNDWLIGNSSLANSPASGTLANLAAVRVIGRPFTCSEYDHPYPNLYNAEGNLMLAAVAAFQDWSATFQFAWSHGDSYERDEASSFFDMCANQTKMAHLPACYAMFVRGDVKSGPGEFVYAPEMTEAQEMKIMNGSLSGYHRSIASGLGLDKSLALAVYSGVELADLNLPKSDALKNAKKISSWKDLPEKCGSTEKKEIVNEFGEICWNYQKAGKGFFTVDTANSKVFSGFVTEPREFDGLTLDVGETELGWATVSLVKATNVKVGAEKSGVLTSGRYLLTATGLMKNTDAKFVYEGNNITTAGHFGGSNGHAPVLCEGVPATITLKNLDAQNVEVYALTNAGDRAQKLDVESVDGGARFAFGSEQKTIWYEVVVK